MFFSVIEIKMGVQWICWQNRLCFERLWLRRRLSRCRCENYKGLSVIPMFLNKVKLSLSEILVKVGNSPTEWNVHVSHDFCLSNSDFTTQSQWKKMRQMYPIFPPEENSGIHVTTFSTFLSPHYWLTELGPVQTTLLGGTEDDDQRWLRNVIHDEHAKLLLLGIRP